MNLILLTDTDLVSDTRATLIDQRADHIRTILKAQLGGTVEVGRINGLTATAAITSISDTEVTLEVETWREPLPVQPAIDLICALPRPQLLKRVLRICGMMAVRRLDLIRANRVEKSFFDSPLLEPASYQRYLIEGMSQGKFTRMPAVHIHHRFRPFWEDTLPGREETDAVKLLAEGETERLVSDIEISRSSHVQLAVGPEGGWVPFELEMMKSAGFAPVNLGPWVLRVDAAVIAGLAQIEMRVASDAS